MQTEIFWQLSTHLIRLEQPQIFQFSAIRCTRGALELHHRAVLGCAKQRGMNSL